MKCSFTIEPRERDSFKLSFECIITTKEDLDRISPNITFIMNQFCKKTIVDIDIQIEMENYESQRLAESFTKLVRDPLGPPTSTIIEFPLNH